MKPFLIASAAFIGCLLVLALCFGVGAELLVRRDPIVAPDVIHAAMPWVRVGCILVALGVARMVYRRGQTRPDFS